MISGRIALAEGETGVMNAADKPRWLRDLVRTFGISFRLRPMYVSLAGGRPEIGFELELIGTHAAAEQHTGNRCVLCLRVLFALLDLADRGLCEEKTLVRPIGARYEKRIRYTASSRDWPEVVLCVTIVRPMGLDDVEKDRMLALGDDVRKALQDLGCREVLFDGATQLDRSDSFAPEGMAA